MLEQNLRVYAKALLTTGVNLQKNQTLVINVDVEHQEFAHLVAEEAYALGAKEVCLNWRSTVINKLRLTHVEEDVLNQVPNWIPAYYQHNLDEGVAVLSLISANPYALAGIPAPKIATASRSFSKAIKFYHEAIMDSRLTWCVAAVSSETWANLLGYEGTKEEKINQLWDTIFTLCRVANISEEEQLDAHLARLSQRTSSLNALQLRKLHYTCPNGTDLVVTLPERHLWLGGQESAKTGVIFDANIPTEEAFTAPHYAGTEGIVYSTKPLIYQGNEINEFFLEFKEGKVVRYGAKTGEEFLKNLIETDEFSPYLGEVALVDHYSPISQSNTIFFETLFDENASCHLALGAAYPTCLANSDGLTEEALRERGLNSSLAHTDFMIGHESMNIMGYDAEGNKVPVMEAGRLLL